MLPLPSSLTLVTVHPLRTTVRAARVTQVSDPADVPALRTWSMAQLLHEVRVYGRLGGSHSAHIVACLGHSIKAPPTPRVEVYLERMSATLRDHLTARHKSGACLTVPEVSSSLQQDVLRRSLW